MPGQPTEEGPARHERSPPAAGDVDQAQGRRKPLHEREPVPLRREPQIVNDVARLVQLLPDRIFDPRGPPDLPDDREVRAFRIPVGLPDVFNEFPRSAARHRHARESAGSEGSEEIRLLQTHRELTGFRDPEQRGTRDTKRPRFPPIDAGEEDFRGLVVPRRAVKDRLAVRRKARLEHVATTERQAAIADLIGRGRSAGRAGDPATREEGDCGERKDACRNAAEPEDPFRPRRFDARRDRRSADSR